MYTLSTILSAIEELTEVDRTNLSISLNNDLEIISNVISQVDIVNPGKAVRSLEQIKKKINEANNEIAELVALLNQFDTAIEKEKMQAHQKLLKETHHISSHNFDWPTEEEHIWHKKQWKASDWLIDEIAGMIGQYIDWRLPVVYFEPNAGVLTNYLVSGEPFYVVDEMALPIQLMLDTFHEATVNKILHYKKSEVHLLESNQVGMCVSWQNIPFKRLGQVGKDIKIMADLVAPGGYVMFDYIDASCADTAKLVEEGQFAFQWKERIHQFVKENNLEIVHEINFIGHYQILLVCRKNGSTREVNLSNKLALVLPDEDILSDARTTETELRKYYKNITSSLARDLKNLSDRDYLLNQLNEQRKIDATKITENKLNSALNHLTHVLAEYSSEHPVVLEAILNASKLTYSIGRVKDSRNLLKRVSNDIEKIHHSKSLYKNFHEWLDFLNNN